MPYSRPVTELIKARFSCRAYLERPIEQEKRQILLGCMSPPQTGPLGTTARFELVAATDQDRSALKGLGTYGFIRGCTGFIVGAVGPGPKNLEDFGYLMERIVLCATDASLGTCWLGGSFTKSSFAKRISASGEEEVPAVIAVGYMAAQAGQGDVIRQIAGSARRLPWERLFFEGQFGAPLSREAAGGYAVPLDMVRLAPSASNNQPWRIVKEMGRDVFHFYLQRTPGYNRGFLKRLLKLADLQRVDMGIAMSHFELTAREMALAGRWEIAEPGLAVPDDLTAYTASWVG